MSGSWRRRLERAILAGVAAVAVTVLGIACDGPAPPPTAPPSVIGPTSDASIAGTAPPGSSAPSSAGRPASLLILSGRPGSMTLERIDPTGARHAIALPTPDATWISTDVDGHVLLTAADGRAYRAQTVDPDAPTWTALGAPGSTPAGRRGFGTLSADGTRAAFLVADPAGSGPAELGIVDLASSTQTAVELTGRAEGGAPMWSGGRLVVLVRGPDDDVGSVIVDVSTGTVTAGPGPASTGSAGWTDPIDTLSIAADGSSLAISSRLDPRPEIRPARAWLAGQATAAEPVILAAEADGSKTFSWLALAASGDALAIVRTNGDGDAVAVSVAIRRTAWTDGDGIPLVVGATRAIVAWLP